MKNLPTFEEFLNEDNLNKYSMSSVFDILDSIKGELGMYDIYPGFFMNTEDANSDDDYFYPNKQIAQREIKSLLSFFKGLKTPVPIYRTIKAKSVEDIDIEYPGESWSWDKDSALNFGRQNVVGANFLLIAEIDKKYINWEATFRRYFKFSNSLSGEEENELVVDKESQIKNIKIEKII